MFNKIIHSSIHNKSIIGLFTFALLRYGIYSVNKLPIDAVPDITKNKVQIITIAPSQSALDIERLVTSPIEQTMDTIPKIEQMCSFLRFGLSVVTLIFEDGVDIDWARQQANECLATATSEIAEGLGNPELAVLLLLPMERILVFKRPCKTAGNV